MSDGRRPDDRSRFAAPEGHSWRWLLPPRTNGSTAPSSLARHSLTVTSRGSDGDAWAEPWASRADGSSITASRPNRWPSRAVKRFVDAIGGSILAIFATPVVIVLAAALAVQLRSWPFFVHERIGRGGKPMRFPKLRTLHRATPRYADKTDVELEPGSRLARWLRERHLDELPQLYLVPLGKLSLVGPRPRMAAEAAKFDDDHVLGRARVTVRQGCTGLWQVGAHTHGTVSDFPEYDFFYLQHGSVRLDIWILWRTLVQFVSSGSSVSLEAVPRWALGRGFAPMPSMHCPDNGGHETKSVAEAQALARAMRPSASAEAARSEAH